MTEARIWPAENTTESIKDKDRVITQRKDRPVARDCGSVFNQFEPVEGLAYKRARVNRDSGSAGGGR